MSAKPQPVGPAAFRRTLVRILVTNLAVAGVLVMVLLVARDLGWFVAKQGTLALTLTAALAALVLVELPILFRALARLRLYLLERDRERLAARPPSGR